MLLIHPPISSSTVLSRPLPLDLISISSLLLPQLPLPPPAPAPPPHSLFDFSVATVLPRSAAFLSRHLHTLFRFHHFQSLLCSFSSESCVIIFILFHLFALLLFSSLLSLACSEGPKSANDLTEDSLTFDLFHLLSGRRLTFCCCPPPPHPPLFSPLLLPPHLPPLLPLPPPLPSPLPFPTLPPNLQPPFPPPPPPPSPSFQPLPPPHLPSILPPLLSHSPHPRPLPSLLFLLSLSPSHPLILLHVFPLANSFRSFPLLPVLHNPSYSLCHSVSLLFPPPSSFASSSAFSSSSSAFSFSSSSFSSSSSFFFLSMFSLLPVITVKFIERAGVPSAVGQTQHQQHPSSLIVAMKL